MRPTEPQLDCDPRCSTAKAKSETCGSRMLLKSDHLAEICSQVLPDRSLSRKSGQRRPFRAVSLRRLTLVGWRLGLLKVVVPKAR